MQEEETTNLLTEVLGTYSATTHHDADTYRRHRLSETGT